ncbi:MAG: hypothetical protein KAG64_01125 [Bacteroidales bacterium]|nr:hypothetical protein [Bacteroidales bacterium]
MKKINLLFAFIALLAFTQCNTPEAKTESKAEIQKPISEVVEDESKPFYQGSVKEAIDAGGYTYLRIEEDLSGHKHEEGHEHKDFWIAVTKTSAKIGDVVRFQKEMVTEQFHSKILDRTFDELMFASNLQYKVKE